MSKPLNITLDEFLSFFPEVDLPIILTEDSISVFSKENKALPPIAIETYISEWEQIEDELVEFIPCIKIAVQKDIFALVYWKAELLSYQYFLVTINNSGQMLARKVIAGLISNGEDIMRSAATIKEDLTIHVVSGNESSDTFDPKESKPYYMEIMPDGSIISFEEENNLWQEKNEALKN